MEGMEGPLLDAAQVRSFVSPIWNNDVIPVLEEYIKIPNLSPFFVTEDAASQAVAKDAQDKAMKLILDWVNKQPVTGMAVELLETEGKTPLLFVEVAPSEGVDVAASGTVVRQ